MQIRKSTLDLPTAHFREIGRAIVTFAHLEWLLKGVVYEILGLDKKQGRLAVREPRAKDYPQLYADLIRSRNLTPPDGLKALKKQIEKVEEFRNKLAHGIWTEGEHHSQPILQVVAGSWAPDEDDDLIKRKIKPEGIHVDLAALRDGIKQMNALSHSIMAARNSIVAVLATSPKKSA